MSLPTILLVPGAWHTPAHYTAITSYLISKGYPVICNQNQTCGTENASLDANDDAAAIRKVIDSVEGDVIVAMHSCGGLPGSVAARGAENVIGLVFVGAFVVPVGETAMEAPRLGNEERGELVVDVSGGVF